MQEDGRVYERDCQTMTALLENAIEGAQEVMQQGLKADAYALDQLAMTEIRGIADAEAQALDHQAMREIRGIADTDADALGLQATREIRESTEAEIHALKIPRAPLESPKKPTSHAKEYRSGSRESTVIDHAEPGTMPRIVLEQTAGAHPITIDLMTSKETVMTRDGRDGPEE